MQNPQRVPPESYCAVTCVSPDGQRPAVAIRTLTETSLWIYDLRRGGLTLATRNGEAELPLWSPDGRRLVFTWRLAGGWGLAVWPADGTGPPTIVVKGDLVPSFFTPDGRQVAVVRQGRDILMVSLDGQKPTVQPLMETEAGEWAPDGQRFYATLREAPAPPRAVTHINLIEHWFEELKAKVPAR